MEVVPFRLELTEQVVDLIVGIQRAEFGIDITAEQQPDLRQIPAFYQVGAGNFWVALAAGRVVGTIALLDIGRSQGALRKMFVHRDFRGEQRGTAQRLLEALLDWCAAHGVADILLGTTAKFHAAHRFYEKSGFSEIDRSQLPPAFPIMAVDTKFYRRRLDQDPLLALDCNYLDANRIFVSFSDKGEYVERRDVAIVSCGLPVVQLNWGFLRPPHGDVATTAAAVRSYFTERGLPFKLAFRGDQRPPLAALEAAGWQRKDDPTPGMTLAIPASVPTAPTPLSIRPVRTAAELVGFRECAFLGFGYPVRAARIFLHDRIRALPQVRMYAGLVDGAVVATSLLVATGTVAGIYWVATLEAHRGRGYGAALTWAAVAGARELGCTRASLQASKLGRPVYAGMGFDHVLDYESLHPPE